MIRLQWLRTLCACVLFSTTAAAQTPFQKVVFSENFDHTGAANSLAKTTPQTGGFFTVTDSKLLAFRDIALPATERMLLLTFQSRFDAAKVFGIGHVRISTDDGASWQLLHAVDGASDWQASAADLTPFAGQNILLSFESAELENASRTNWDIDNVVIAEMEAAAAASAGVLEVGIKSLNASLFPFIFMNVTADTNGAAFPDLQQGDFVVCENDVPQTDLFEVTPPGSTGGSRLADIVFIMDNSGSLGDEQQAVRDNMIAFVDSLAASGVDFALGLCRYGASQNSGNPIIEDNGQLTTDANYFKNSVWARNTINGFTEPGYFAITQSATQFNFRPGAQRIFIIITDERADQGGATQQDAIDIALNNSISVYALIDPVFLNAGSDLAVVALQTGGKAFNITSPFNTVLEDIEGAVANTYVIRYRSSQPTVDGIERIVKVVATHNAESDSAFGKYTPGASPVIRRDSATVALSNQAWQQNTPFQITVIVTDAAEPFTQAVTLFYRTTNSNAYSSVAMVKQTLGGSVVASKNREPYEPVWHRVAAGDSSIWTATIPGNIAQAPGVDYYVTATDGISTTSAPETDPQSQPFQIAVLPNQPPSVAHTPPANYTPGLAFDVNATVIDTTNKLANVTLHYRRVGDILYQVVPMINTAGDNFKETIPAGFMTQSGVQYFIRAVDDFGVATVRFFAIFPAQGQASIVVLQPNGGENWLVCSDQAVKWSSINVATVKIEYSLDNGATWKTLADSVNAGAGEYFWQVPGAVTANALVRISAVSNPLITDNSDATFAISDFPKVENWNSYHACNSNLMENYVRAIVVDCDGVVYVGSRNSGLLVMDEQGAWSQFSMANSGIADNSILAMALQGDDALWIGTNGGGLSKWTEQGWQTFNTSNGLPHNRVWAITVDKRLNDVWVGTSDGLAKYNTSGWTIYKDVLPSTTIYAIAIAPDGKIWLGTADGVVVYNGATWTHYTFANSGLLDRTILALTLDKAGRAWIGTAKGLSRFDGQNWASFTQNNSPLPANSIRAIFVDGNDNKWIGTWGGGVAKLGNGWTVYQNGSSGLLDDYVISMFIDCNGHKWIGTETGGFTQYIGDPAVPVSVGDEAVSQQPSAFGLAQNYPNPFNPSTMINYQLPMSSDVSLSIYDVQGQLVRRLVAGQQPAGSHSALWDATDERGQRVSSGIYVYRLRAGDFETSRKLLLLK